ncbi:unnamed protein product, partial [Rotaria sp. Silwood1]
MVFDKTLYDILEVEPDATEAEIRKAIRRKLLQYHPDRGGSYEMMKKVHAAREILTDPKERDIYDRYGLQGLKHGTSGGTSEFSGFFGGCFQGSRARLGFAVGGAKDVNNFRENIQNNYIPVVTDISYEGLFNDYFFDTGNQQQDTTKQQLFCPSYSMAITKNLLQEKNEEQFTTEENTEYDTRSKMLITIEVISKLLDHLKPNDRVAVITFNDEALVIQPMKKLIELNIEQLKHYLSTIRAHGGTNLNAGIDCSASLFETISSLKNNDYDNRILFLTDAQPNQGGLDEKDFYSRIEQLAKQRIYTSFIGIGIDLNTQLIYSITKQRGANYFSVHDSKKFLQLLDKDFDLILTPLVFNVEMKFQSDLFDIEHVYGSPECDETKQGELIKINTLFPSRTDNEQQTRGGIVL